MSLLNTTPATGCSSMLSNENRMFWYRNLRNLEYSYPFRMYYLHTLRAREKITSHFCISPPAHLWPIPHSQNPRNSSLFLWFCSLGSAKPEPNLSANSAKLFFREPLASSICGFERGTPCFKTTFSFASAHSG